MKFELFEQLSSLPTIVWIGICIAVALIVGAIIYIKRSNALEKLEKSGKRNQVVRGFAVLAVVALISILCLNIIALINVEGNPSEKDLKKAIGKDIMKTLSDEELKDAYAEIGITDENEYEDNKSSLRVALAEKLDEAELEAKMTEKKAEALEELVQLIKDTMTEIIISALVGCLIYFILGFAISYERDGSETQADRTRAMVYGALAVSLSFVLSYVKVFEMPNGGTITLASMLPIIVYAYNFGLRKGLTASLVYGVLQFIQGPYVIHWAQPFLDYIFAFGALGLAGLFMPLRSKKLFGKFTYLPVAVIVAGIARLIMHVLAGVIFWYEGAGEQNVWVYSIVYNATYMLPDLAICFVISLIPKVADLLNGRISSGKKAEN